MRKIAILTALVSSPLFAHQVQPETKFFQEELKRDPMVGQVLAWCGLIGITNEETCRAEMYKGDVISKTKIEAASRCIDKSGLKYRVAFDEFFKVDTAKQAQFSHQDMGSRWHTEFLKDPAEGKDAVAHRHFYTETDIRTAGMERGQFYVNDLKSRSTTDTVTSGSSLSGTASAGASGVIVHGEGSVTKGKEDSETKGAITQKQLDEAYAKGEAEGRAHPESTTVTPHGGCRQGGDCYDAQGKVANLDAAKREEVKDSSPKPEAPKTGPTPVKTEETKDPFAPFTSGSDTGGMPTATADVDKVKKEDLVKTPVTDPTFIPQMNDCVSVEENELLIQQGSKTVDPNVESEEDKKARAEQNLLAGFCDSSSYSTSFCSNWTQESFKTKVEGADQETASQYDNAMSVWQTSGYCNPFILGAAFCSAAHFTLVSTPVDAEPISPVEEVDHTEITPQDGPAVTPDYSWHPPETTAQPE